MFDRFSDRARKALSLARQEAELAKCDYIGTEHLLLGILRENGGVAAAILLEDKDPGKIAARLRALSAAASDAALPNQIPFTPRAKAALRSAVAAAEAFSHDYVGTQHLLLGVLRDKETVASQVLAEFELTEDSVAKAIRDAASEPAEATHASAADPEALGEFSARMAYAARQEADRFAPSPSEADVPFLLRKKVRVAALSIAFMAPLILIFQAKSHYLAFSAAWGFSMFVYSPNFRPHRNWGLVLTASGIAHAVAALSISIIDPGWLWVAWCWFAAVVAFYAGDAQLSLLKSMEAKASTTGQD